MQRHLFDSEKDTELRQLIQEKDALQARLYAVNTKLVDFKNKARGIPLTPGGGLTLTRSDDGQELTFHFIAAKKPAQLMVDTKTLLTALKELQLCQSNQ